MIKEYRLIRALCRQPVDCTPVWMMRQAGRYLPEYRALRQQAKDFLTLCKTPDLACEVTLQPLKRFDLDAAIIFSDILTIPDAYQLGLYFVENEGPCFQNPIGSLNDIEKLPTLDPEVDLKYVMDAIRLAKQELRHKVPLIGFAGSPWTIATYMVEGKSSKTFSKIKKMLYRDPKMLELLLSHLATSVSDYLNAQIKAGADTVMIFDTWGGVLTHPHYLEFSLKYMQRIVNNIKKFPHERQVPIILFTKNSGSFLVEMANTGCDAVGIDWTVSLDSARQLIGDKVAIQGNLDPAALYAEPLQIQKEVKNVLQKFGKGPGHIFNLGHGIFPDIDPEKVSIMIEAVHCG